MLGLSEDSAIYGTIDYDTDELFRSAYEILVLLNNNLKDDYKKIPKGFDEIVEELSFKLNKNKSVRTNLSL